MARTPAPPPARRIRTGVRTERVSIGITAEQRAEADRLAQRRGLAVSSYLYELVTEGLVNDAASVAEEEGEPAPAAETRRRT